MPVTAPADKRFLRSHVRPVRRRSPWRVAAGSGRVLVCLAVLCLGAYYLVTTLTTSRWLRIERITVKGTVRMSKSDVVALLDSLRGQNILRADLDEARRRLLESRWISDAVLRKRLPSSVDVGVSERHPIGIARLPGGQLFLIDEQGTLIDQFGPKYAEFDLPIVDGLTTRGKAQIDENRLDLAARVIASLGERPELARRVSQIDVTAENDVEVLLDADNALLRLGDRDFRQRLEGYIGLAPTLRERVASIDYVDLRYGSHVFVGTGGRGGASGSRRAVGAR